MAVLSTYQQDTARLLRDRSHIMVPLDELTSYINHARRDAARITGCVRCLIAGNVPFGSGATPGLMVPGGMTPGSQDTTITTFTTLPGVEKYHFRYAEPFLRAQWAGVDTVIDLMNVSVSWGAAARPTMEWTSWDELQALARIYSAGVFTYPYTAACQGDGTNQQLFLFPVPGQALEMEWDAACLPLPIYQDSDIEAIPDSFTEAVKYQAASYAYLASQRFGSADLMHGLFLDHLGIDRVASGRGNVPSYYVGR